MWWKYVTSRMRMRIRTIWDFTSAPSWIYLQRLSFFSFQLKPKVTEATGLNSCSKIRHAGRIGRHHCSTRSRPPMLPKASVRHVILLYGVQQSQLIQEAISLHPVRWVSRNLSTSEPNSTPQETRHSIGRWFLMQLRRHKNAEKTVKSTLVRSVWGHSESFEYWDESGGIKSVLGTIYSGSHMKFEHMYNSFRCKKQLGQSHSLHLGYFTVIGEIKVR